MTVTWQEVQVTKDICGYQSTLEGGLQVLLVPQQDFQEAHAYFTTRYGSTVNRFVHRTTGQWYQVPDGVAHFLEHKMFDQPDGSDVFLAFANLGVSANAYTSQKQTTYLFSGHNHVAQATDILLDYVQSPHFTNESVEKEKGIIEQEILMYDDDFSWVGYRLALALAYPSHPVGKDIAGTVESIYQITTEDLYACYQTFYHPSNMHLVITGNFELDQLQQTILHNQSAKAYDISGEIEVECTVDQSMPLRKCTKQQIDAQTDYVSAMYKDICFQDTTTPIRYQEMIVDLILDMLFSDISPHYYELVDQNIVEADLSYYSNYETDYAYFIMQVATKDPNTFIEQYRRFWYEGEMITEEQFEKVRKSEIGTIIQIQNSPSYIGRVLNTGAGACTPHILLQWLESMTFAEVVAKYEEIVSHLDDYLVFVFLEARLKP